MRTHDQATTLFVGWEYTQSIYSIVFDLTLTTNTYKTLIPNLDSTLHFIYANSEPYIPCASTFYLVYCGKTFLSFNI